jgi:hypothetical protein
MHSLGIYAVLGDTLLMIGGFVLIVGAVMKRVYAKSAFRKVSSVVSSTNSMNVTMNGHKIGNGGEDDKKD